MNALDRLLKPIRRRLVLLLSWATGVQVKSTLGLQRMQLELLADELLDDVPYVEHYGMSGVPPSGFEAVTASMGGVRSRTLVLTAFHRQFRLKDLKQGEVALYDDLGNKVVLRRDKIHVEAVTKLQADAPIIEATATTSATVTVGQSKVAMLPASTTVQVGASSAKLTPTAITANAATITATATTTANLVAGASSVTLSASGAAITAPVITLAGNVAITGKLTTTKDVIAKGISLASHVHSGVTSGPSTTGGPV